MKKVVRYNQKELSLEEFNKNNMSHIDDLFFLIKSKKNNISNLMPPSKEQHKNFCFNHPYRFWFLVYEKESLLGSIYVTYENAIGINFLDIQNECNAAIVNHVLENIDSMPAKPSLVQSDFYCNVAPENKDLIELLKKLGAVISQVSYKFK